MRFFHTHKIKVSVFIFLLALQLFSSAERGFPGAAAGWIKARTDSSDILENSPIYCEHVENILTVVYAANTLGMSSIEP